MPVACTIYSSVRVSVFITRLQQIDGTTCQWRDCGASPYNITALPEDKVNLVGGYLYLILLIFRCLWHALWQLGETHGDKMPVAHTMYSFSVSMFVLHNTGGLQYRIVFRTIFLIHGVLCRWKLGNWYRELYSLQLRTTTSTPVVYKRDQALISGISIDTFIYAAHSSLGVRLIDISHMYQRIIQGLY